MTWMSRVQKAMTVACAFVFALFSLPEFARSGYAAQQESGRSKLSPRQPGRNNKIPATLKASIGDRESQPKSDVSDATEATEDAPSAERVRVAGKNQEYFSNGDRAIIDPSTLAPLVPVQAPISSSSLTTNANILQRNNAIIELVDFRDQPLGEAMRLFSEQSGLNIVPSVAANLVKVNLYLHNVRATDVLENLTKTHDLYFRIDEKSGVIRIYTTSEYEQNLASFREERTKVFTLLYPNPIDAAVAIQDLFGERVNLNFGVGDQDAILDLIYRLNRFDLVDSRSLGLGAFQGNYAYGGRSFSRLGGLGGFTGSNPLVNRRTVTVIMNWPR